MPLRVGLRLRLFAGLRLLGLLHAGSLVVLLVDRLLSRKELRPALAPLQAGLLLLLADRLLLLAGLEVLVLVDWPLRLPALGTAAVLLTLLLWLGGLWLMAAALLF